jgi:hypothetical protein
LYEGFEKSYDDLIDKPEILQGEQGPPGISPEDPGYLPPTPLPPALERGYQYVSNTAPDAGYEVFRLSGDGGVFFTNALFPLTSSLNVPKDVVIKYEIGAGLLSQAPQDWSVTFYDEEDLEIGADVRTAETFSLGQVREFAVNPGASISKVVLAISKVALNVARDSIATRVNEHGVIKVVPPKTPRFTHDFVTLAPLGVLIQPEAENLITQSDITQWRRVRVTVTPTLSIFGDPVYFMKGNGAFLQHNIVLPYPTGATSTQRTLSIYMKNADNRFAQIAIGSDQTYMQILTFNLV